MKTLCVLESVSRADGGIFEAERALQCALAEGDGVDVRVVGVRDEFTDADLAKWGALRPRVAALRGPAGFGYAPGLAGLLDKDVDLAYAATLWKYPSWAVLNWQKKTRKPVVAAPHGSLDAWALNNSRWKKRVAAWLFKDEQLRRATCFRALCAAEANAIRAYGLRQRIEVVPNGVDLPEKLTTEDTESTEGRRRLLFLGRIHPKKGLVGALRAWAELRNSASAIRDSAEWQFVIAGWDQGGHEAELKSLCRELGLRFKEAKLTTEDTECIEVGAGQRLVGQAGAAFSNPTPSELAQDHESTSPTRCASGPADSENLKLNSYKLKTERAPDIQGGLRPENGSSRRLPLPDVDVVFFGPAFGEDKEALLRSAEAFILPSFSEGLPMSVLEAWAYGLPVVMTPECNLPEGFASAAALEIRNSAGGFERMRTLIEMTDQERAAMGMRGRRLVEERFTWPKVAAQMRRLYEELLGR
jgi:glycosyltransferase involved in cell wall biosynthesis